MRPDPNQAAPLPGEPAALDEARRLRRQAEWEEAQLTPLALVEIETAARCNRRCCYCPVSTHPAREGQMSAELFAKIVSDLRTMGFRGTMSFHFYNEPLLDERLETFIQLAHRELPEAYLLLYTNGDALTSARAESLIAARLGHIRVSLHDSAAEARLMRLLDGLESRLAQRISPVRYYDQSLALDNRCGTIALPSWARLPDRLAGCHNITSMVIDWQGRVPLCCNDFLVANPLGDVNESSVQEIWDRSRPLRREIFLGNFQLEACRICTGLKR
jgi:8-amino-3,8-dideoxy-alpha-D-manno-octulosonate transaminase